MEGIFFSQVRNQRRFKVQQVFHPYKKGRFWSWFLLSNYSFWRWQWRSTEEKCPVSFLYRDKRRLLIYKSVAFSQKKRKLRQCSYKRRITIWSKFDLVIFLSIFLLWWMKDVVVLISTTKIIFLWHDYIVFCVCDSGSNSAWYRTQFYGTSVTYYKCTIRQI